MSDIECFHTHLCIASAEATPNLTPVLNPGFRPKQVVMLVSSQMEWEVKCQERVLRRYGIAVKRLKVPDAYDASGVAAVVAGWLAEAGEADVVLNVTGGTKPLSIGAYNVFRDRGLPVFYVHPQTDRLIWLHPSDRVGFDLHDTLTVTDLIEAYGGEMVSVASSGRVGNALRTLSRELVDGFDRYYSCLPTLNYLASTADPSHRVRLEKGKKPGMDALINAFDRAGLLRRKGEEIVFADSDARFLVNGGWLEMYALSVLHHLDTKIKLQDVAQGAEIRFRVRGGEVCNELDIVFLANNRPYVIECKTRSRKAYNKKGGDGLNADLYRLDSVADIAAGANGRALYLSYAPLSEAELRRAELLGVAVCHGNQLKNLEPFVRAWVTAKV